ncbi:MAG TPA: glycoside hydrolase family 47 protein [Candidatus Baltobacteraceae bacterium]|nr:glycoside hydrolase family 47 protein [Candidatus Baltobacteraceae bacterium]
MRRGAFIAASVATALRARAAGAQSGTSTPAPGAIADEVRTEFLHAWNGYKRLAWGRDEVRPVSGTTNDFFVPGTTFGLSIVEALDTLYVMGLDDELTAATRWVLDNLRFDVDGDVQMFEAVIRLVGGLLAGYAATGEKALLERARECADRLLPCFTKSPTGAPYRYANLRTGAVREPKMNLAEIGTNVLEFGELTRLTGDPKYLRASLRAYEVVIAKRSPLNLLPTYFDVERGIFTDDDAIAPNPPVDSFYEYLWGGWQMLGDTRCRDWYRLLTDAILKYQVDRTRTGLWFRQVDARTGTTTGTRQIELAAFYAELLAKGGDRAIGEAYYDAFTAVARRYGIIPEIFDFTTLDVISPSNEFRPEYANAAFDLWFLTRDPKYRDTAYAHFLALRDNCRIANGYTIVDDVRTRPMKLGDLFPAYGFAENFKYLYLIFADTPRFDPSGYYLSTEGKILRGLVRA